MLEGKANADIFSIWPAHVRLIGPVYIGCTNWPISLVCLGRRGRSPFSACVSSARRLIEAPGEMVATFLFVVSSGTVAASWRGWPHLIASWRWWPHGRAMDPAYSGFEA